MKCNIKDLALIKSARGHTCCLKHKKTTKDICKNKKIKTKNLKINTNRVYASYNKCLMRLVAWRESYIQLRILTKG